MTDVRPNLRKMPRDLWAIEHAAAGIEPGEFALKPRFGKGDRPSPPWVPVVLIGLGLLGLGYVLFL